VLAVVGAERVTTPEKASCGHGRKFDVLVGFEEGFAVLSWPSARWWTAGWGEPRAR